MNIMHICTNRSVHTVEISVSLQMLKREKRGANLIYSLHANRFDVPLEIETFAHRTCDGGTLCRKSKAIGHDVTCELRIDLLVLETAVICHVKHKYATQRRILCRNTWNWLWKRPLQSVHCVFFSLHCRCTATHTHSHVNQAIQMAYISPPLSSPFVWCVCVCLSECVWVWVSILQDILSGSRWFRANG